MLREGKGFWNLQVGVPFVYSSVYVMQPWVSFRLDRLSGLCKKQRHYETTGLGFGGSVFIHIINILVGIT